MFLNYLKYLDQELRSSSASENSCSRTFVAWPGSVATSQKFLGKGNFLQPWHERPWLHRDSKLTTRQQRRRGVLRVQGMQRPSTLQPPAARKTRASSSVWAHHYFVMSYSCYTQCVFLLMAYNLVKQTLEFLEGITKCTTDTASPQEGGVRL